MPPGMRPQPPRSQTLPTPVTCLTNSDSVNAPGTAASSSPVYVKNGTPSFSARLHSPGSPLFKSMLARPQTAEGPAPLFPWPPPPQTRSAPWRFPVYTRSPGPHTWAPVLKAPGSLRASPILPPYGDPDVLRADPVLISPSGTGPENGKSENSPTGSPAQDRRRDLLCQLHLVQDQAMLLCKHIHRKPPGSHPWPS